MTMRKNAILFAALCVLEITSAATMAPLIYFKDGLLGVNFFGFHAAAGLNGAGLHAEAGTPFGQRAGAGLGGTLKEDGSVGGRLYAGATAGGNVKALAGLGGSVDNGESPRAVGGLFSAASAGSAKAGRTLVGGIANGESFRSVEEVTVSPALKVAKKPHYVRGHKVVFDRFFPGDTNDTTSTTTTTTTTNAQAHQEASESNDRVVSERADDAAPAGQGPLAPRLSKVKVVSLAPANTDAGSRFLSSFFAAPAAVAPRDSDEENSVAGPAVTGSRGTFFRDVFNIPISVLGAVSRLLSNNVVPKTTVQIDKTVTSF